MMALQTVKGGVGVPGPDSAQGRVSRDHAEVRSQGRVLTPPLCLPSLLHCPAGGRTQVGHGALQAACRFGDRH